MLSWIEWLLKRLHLKWQGERGQTQNLVGCNQSRKNSSPPTSTSLVCECLFFELKYLKFPKPGVMKSSIYRDSKSDKVYTLLTVLSFPLYMEYPKRSEFLFCIQFRLERVKGRSVRVSCPRHTKSQEMV